MPSRSNALTRIAPLTPPPTGLLMASDLAASIACLNFSAVEMSGFGAPFCTARPMAERATSARRPGGDLALLDQLFDGLGVDDRDVGRLALGDALGDARATGSTPA